jgi:hypothetical protein
MKPIWDESKLRFSYHSVDSVDVLSSSGNPRAEDIGTIETTRKTF